MPIASDAAVTNDVLVMNFFILIPPRIMNIYELSR